MSHSSGTRIHVEYEKTPATTNSSLSHPSPTLSKASALDHKPFYRRLASDVFWHHKSDLLQKCSIGTLEYLILRLTLSLPVDLRALLLHWLLTMSQSFLQPSLFFCPFLSSILFSTGPIISTTLFQYPTHPCFLVFSSHLNSKQTQLSAFSVPAFQEPNIAGESHRIEQRSVPIAPSSPTSNGLSTLPINPPGPFTLVPFHPQQWLFQPFSKPPAPPSPPSFPQIMQSSNFTEKTKSVEWEQHLLLPFSTFSTCIHNHLFCFLS